MCGINGIIYKIKKPNVLEVCKMTQAIKHRGPDDEGIYKFKEKRVIYDTLRLPDSVVYPL